MKSTLTFLSLLLGLVFSFEFQAQPKNESELQNNYTDYFKSNRHSVFLHLNKNILLQNENLWFAGYVYDLQTKTPEMETTNLEVSVFNANGKFIESLTLYTFQGKASGYLPLTKKDYKPGKYFIRASTAYIENLNEDLSFKSEFQIINDSKRKQPEGNLTYDLQLLPEGGHLVQEVRNTVGVKLIDQHGLGVEFEEGHVLDNDLDTISKFRSNRFGHASFNIQPDENSTYSVKIYLNNGEVVEKTLQDPNRSGIVMRTTLKQDDLQISLLTNENSLPVIKDEKFYLGISQDGNIKNLVFKFPNNKKEAIFNFSKDSLYRGINRITLFNKEFQPILERLVFNDHGLKLDHLSTGSVKKINDSIQIEIKGIKDETARLSISTLPQKTEAYSPDHSIISAFLLKPYLKGNIENGDYYFSDEHSARRRNYDLDLLLLTQGWSKYPWSQVLTFKRDRTIGKNKGFDLEGEIFSKTRPGDKVFIRNEKSGLFEIIDVEDNNRFSIKNLFIEDSTQISVGLLRNRNGKMKKPSISVQIFPQKERTRLDAEQIQPSLKPVPVLSIPKNFITDNEVLDTVNLKASKRSEKKKDFLNAPTSSALSNYIEINETIASSNYYITDLIEKNFFRVRRTPANIEIWSQTPFTFRDDLGPSPVIFLNGVRMGQDLSFLYNLRTSEVKSIYLNRSAAAGYGGNYEGGGVIKIKTKTGASRFNNTNNSTLTLIANNGYQPYKEFYAPKYNSYNNSLFENYGVIDWEPDMVIAADSNKIHSIYNTLQDSIILYIEGITQSGKLISEKIEVKIN
ncbi:Plug domain-containing protein [Pontixanthobacter gangjinensis]|uniref:TonB-dependent receptor plug domain-containing protein n=1 Tax=Christiangramia aestuarii TaxID=1028746 RepID=A0A7K1LMI8_9FLAO|nr:hypothetical protein [Christiangramia aestuarii]MUP42025.1 hypothetical protein [Christiangramia aestuarii]